MARPFAEDLVATLVRHIEKGVLQGTARAGREFAAFVHGMQIGNKSDIRAAHVDVARTMREAVREAYNDNVKSVRKVGPYRRFDRNSGGIERVLRKASLAVGTSSGINFLDRSDLRKEASHWKRLNFGAGEAAGTQPAGFALRVFGQTVGRLRFTTRAQAAFSLPPGFFQHGITSVLPRPEYRGIGSVGAFYPNHASPYKSAVTHGIRGRHFLEAGLEAMAINLGPRYRDLMRKWIQGEGSVGRKVRQVLINA